LPSGIGLGVDLSTGAKKMPIFKLSPSGRTFNNFVIPNGVDASLFNGVTNVTLIFEGMYKYVQYLYNTTRTNIVPYQMSFALEPSLVEIFTKFFSGNSYLTVTKYMLSLYKTRMTAAMNQFAFDDMAIDAINFLPPDYNSDTNKNLYRMFVQYWGTSVITGSEEGGMWEIDSMFQQSLLKPSGPLYEDQVRSNANNEFYNKAIGNGRRVDQVYVDKRRLGSLGCVGGNSAEMCAKDKFGAWQNTLWKNPTPINYEVADFTQMLPSPMRENVKNSIKAHLSEIYQKWSVDFPTCPVCLWGQCGQGQTACKCWNDKITGRACDTCVSGYSGVQCLSNRNSYFIKQTAYPMPNKNTYMFNCQDLKLDETSNIKGLRLYSWCNDCIKGENIWAITTGTCGYSNNISRACYGITKCWTPNLAVKICNNTLRVCTVGVTGGNGVRQRNVTTSYEIFPLR